MIITCEQCKAVYCIADKIIGNNKKQLKCCKCNYIWHYNPHAQISHKKPIYKKILSILFLSITLLLLNFIFFPEFLMNFGPAKDLYNKCGIYDSKDLLLEDFVFKIEEDILIAKGIIKNNSNESKFFPDIRYIVMDKDKNIIFKYHHISNRTMIKAEESIPIYTKILNLNSSAAFLQIDIGNKLELLLK